MTSRETKKKLLMVFANAARIDDIESITQEQIDKMAPAIRKIFQKQYDLYHAYITGKFPDKFDATTPLTSGTFARVTATSESALSQAFKATEPEFRQVLVDHTTETADAVTQSLVKQVESTTKYLTKDELPDDWPSSPKEAKASIEMRWDISDPKQQTRLEERAAKMVKGIDDVTRQDIHDIIVNGHNDGRSYQQIAKDIRDKYNEFSKPAPQRHIRDRAELIAVTEIALASQSTQYEDMVEMASRGWEIEKLWSSTGDDRVSEGCQENTDAGWIPLEDEFPSGDLYPPRFPGCRCSLAFQVVGRENH